MGEGAYINEHSSVGKCLEVLREDGRCWVGRLGGVAWAMMLERMREASRQKYKWVILQTGQLRKPRESRKLRHGGRCSEGCDGSYEG